MRRERLALIARLTVVTALLGLVALPAVSVPKDKARSANEFLSNLSQSVAVRYWLANPEQAPPRLRGRFENLSRSLGASAGASSAQQVPITQQVFNNDIFGLPQNEESITRCRNAPRHVLSGTNDYRGLLNPAENFTGWHYSNNGGRNLTNEGLLPPVTILGQQIASGGDPVKVAAQGPDGKCYFFASSLNYAFGEDFPADFFPNGIGVYRTTPRRLATCNTANEPFEQNPACWPVRRVIEPAPNRRHFYDKEWIDVGNTGDGMHLWAVWADFNVPPPQPAPEVPFTAVLRAARCNFALTQCTRSMVVSGNQEDIQFGDVTIKNGTTYITWSEILGEIRPDPRGEVFIHHLRIVPPGCAALACMTEIRRVATETEPLPFGGYLHANDFRVATYPKNEVKLVNGQPRIYVVWDACRERALEFICEEARIKIRYSDDEGRSWSRTRILSVGNENYFPTIAKDPYGDRIAVAWFTNRRDPIFHNRQDVELVTLDPATLRVTRRQILTRPSNESEADPLLGGFFIGDYIEVNAYRGQALVAYNANYRHVKLLDGLVEEGHAIPQQDNYLARVRL